MEGEGTIEKPFVKTFNSAVFKRHDSELFITICERDDSFELIVVPIRSEPNRYYRINPDGTIIDLVNEV
jgi:hypothetical protein